jgi:4-hydroxybenzoate polyprenyltransferase
MGHIIQLLRPLQWLKNLFVFAPMFFSNNLLNLDFIRPTTIVFLAFCFISSSIYCINDIYDVEADRMHPQKCKRPIASGKVSIRVGYLLAFLCLLLPFGLLFFVKGSNLPYLYLIIGCYWMMNVAYCMKLKRYAIIDVSIIAIGFVMRVLIGGLVTNIWVSHWLVLMTFLITLFLALAKRSDDFGIYEKTGIKPRVSITGYNKPFINEATAIVASVTMVSYIMYSMSDEIIRRMGSPYVYLTSGWVLLGLLRYLQNMIVFGRSGSPTNALLKDKFLIPCIIGWLLTFFIIIYL